MLHKHVESSNFGCAYRKDFVEKDKVYFGDFYSEGLVSIVG